MKVERYFVDSHKGILRVTTADERWYCKMEDDGKTVGGVNVKYIPSVTWICEYYPKGIGFYKWLANKGWDESQSIKEAAGDKGSKIHQGVNMLLRGEVLRYNSPVFNPSSGKEGKEEELTQEEYEALMSFVIGIIQ